MSSRVEFSNKSCPSGVYSSKRESWALGDFCFFSPLLRNLSNRLLNSSSLKSFVNLSGLGSTTFSSSRLRSTGTSVLIVAKNFDILISSTAASIFSRSLPFTSDERLMSSSTEPNSLMSLAAVFSPTPGQPGKLSALSPMRANKSLTCSGVFTPYLSSISLEPIIS